MVIFHLNLETANSFEHYQRQNQHLIKTLCGVKEPIYLIKTEKPISIGTVWLQIYDTAAENGQSLKFLRSIVIIHKCNASYFAPPFELESHISLHWINNYKIIIAPYVHIDMPMARYRLIGENKNPKKKRKKRKQNRRILFTQGVAAIQIQ